MIDSKYAKALQNFGARLENIETKKCNKTVPSIRAIGNALYSSAMDYNGVPFKRWNNDRGDILSSVTLGATTFLTQDPLAASKSVWAVLAGYGWKITWACQKDGEAVIKWLGLYIDAPTQVCSTEDFAWNEVILQIIDGKMMMVDYYRLIQNPSGNVYNKMLNELNKINTLAEASKATPALEYVEQLEIYLVENDHVFDLAECLIDFKQKAIKAYTEILNKHNNTTTQTGESA
jgi:hypothetical protein